MQSQSQGENIPWSGEVPEYTYISYYSFSNKILRISKHNSYRTLFIPVPKGATSITIDGIYKGNGMICIMCDNVSDDVSSLGKTSVLGNLDALPKEFDLNDSYKYISISYYYTTTFTTFEFNK